MNAHPRGFEAAIATPRWIDRPQAKVFLTVPLATIRGTLVAEIETMALVYQEGEDDFGVAEMWVCDLATGEPTEIVRRYNGVSSLLCHHIAVAIAAELNTDAGRRAAHEALAKEIEGMRE